MNTTTVHRPLPAAGAELHTDATAWPARQLLHAGTAHHLEAEVQAATRLAAHAIASAAGPSTGPDPTALRRAVAAVDLDSPLGSSAAALQETSQLYLRDAVYFHHPRYAAHLNCPVAIPAVAADALVGSINTSMDTWDQSAGATLIEQRLVDWTAQRAGLGALADGIFTSGGTQSNLQALLIARDRATADRTGPLPRRLEGLRIYASADSHFSIVRAAALLGLGHDAVVPVPVDANHRMDAGLLEAALRADHAAGFRAMAVVATAGTTDFGAIDPLRACARLAQDHDAWLHVDAAYGCGLLLSSRHHRLLDGVSEADSLTVDFHKSFFQPIGSSALLLRDGADFGRISHHAEYLNPAADAGTVPNQVDKSLQTTRRFDALKLWVTLRTIGADALGALFDEVIDLARAAEDLVDRCPELELAAPVQLSTLVFRFTPRTGHGAHAGGHHGTPAGGHAWAAEELDGLNDAIRARIHASGEAMIAATTVNGRRHLKLTLLNPNATIVDVEQVLAAVLRHGHVLAGKGNA